VKRRKERPREMEIQKNKRGPGGARNSQKKPREETREAGEGAAGFALGNQGPWRNRGKCLRSCHWGMAEKRVSGPTISGGVGEREYVGYANKGLHFQWGGGNTR